jgi:uncharacterized membrane protein
MHIVLFILSILVFLFGVFMLMLAQSAIHEIQAMICFLIASVLFVGSAIVEAIHRQQSQDPRRIPTLDRTEPR